MQTITVIWNEQYNDMLIKFEKEKENQ